MMKTKTQNWPDLAGKLTQSGHVLALRVYYEDTDFAGIVYHANYLRYCERARSDFLRLLGIDQIALSEGAEGEALNFAVKRMAIDFLAPAHMDDVLEVETSISSLTGARLILDQIVNCENETIFTAEVEIVILNAQGRPRRFPKAVRTCLE